MARLRRRSRRTSGRNGCPRRAAAPTITCWGLLAAGNVGNDASLEVFVRWVDRNYPGARLRLVTTNPAEARARFRLPSQALMASPGTARTRFTLARRISDRLRDLGTALIVLPRSTDALVVPGMGILEDSMYVSPWGSPLILALMAVGCRCAGSRFLLVDVGAEFSSSRLTGHLFAFCLRQASHVSVRDELSRQVVLAAAPGREFALAPDLVFAHPAKANCTPVRHRVVVGVISAERSLGARGLGYTPRMARLVLELMNQDLEVVLVGGDATDTEMAQGIADVVAQQDSMSRRPQMVVVDDYSALVEVVATAEVVVASRYHNLVAAISAGRPVVAIGYAPKCADLLNSVGLGEYAYDLEFFEPETVSWAVGEMLVTSDELAQQVKERSQDFATEVEQLLAQVGATMGLSAPGTAMRAGRRRALSPRPRQADAAAVQDETPST